MPVRTDAVRAFQNRVHQMESAQQRDIRLTAQEARNLANELAQLTALLVELQGTDIEQPVEVAVAGSKF